MEFALLNRLIAKPGRRDRVVDILLESGKLFADNSACRLYLVAESADDPNLICVADLWTSEEEHAEALRAPEMQPFVEECMPLLEGMPEQIRVEPVRGMPGDNPLVAFLPHQRAAPIASARSSPATRSASIASRETELPRRHTEALAVDEQRLPVARSTECRPHAERSERRCGSPSSAKRSDR